MKARMACRLHIARYVIEELAEELIMGMKVTIVLEKLLISAPVIALLLLGFIEWF
jgi:hypothetical protein